MRPGKRVCACTSPPIPPFRNYKSECKYHTHADPSALGERDRAPRMTGIGPRAAEFRSTVGTKFKSTESRPRRRGPRQQMRGFRGISTLTAYYHQQYLAKNPNGYCGIGGCGVPFKVAELHVGEKA